MGTEMPQSKTPQEMLIEARNGLEQCRRDILFSSALIVWGENPEEMNLGLLLWRLATRTEEEITRDLIAPAKIELGRPVTDQQVEKTVRKNVRRFAKALDLHPDFGGGSVNWHIDNTKRIQRSLGVPDNPRSQETTIFRVNPHRASEKTA